ncbi:MAG: GNAT family N-acetyltransferase [Gammaproteobacteria bacterium]|nr:GNAT family N-acetyltransferase [Gammaproteobacteria bacterium]
MTQHRPSLRTKRLQLRWLSIDDAELLLSIWNDPAFVRHVGDRGIRTKDDAVQAFSDGPLKLYSEYGYGPYRVSLLENDEAIGICGLFRRDNLDDPDVGFALLPEYCGKGYASEAAMAVVEHAKHGLGLPRLTAIVSPGNAASIGLIEKLGLKFERMIRMPGDSEDISLYGIDW